MAHDEGGREGQEQFALDVEHQDFEPPDLETSNLKNLDLETRDLVNREDRPWFVRPAWRTASSTATDSANR